VCALVCIAAGVGAAGPAAASMTLVIRKGTLPTITFHQDGSRVRIEIPPSPGEPDGDRMTGIVDLKTSETILVYDDVKAFFDMRKALPQVRAELERESRGKALDRRRSARASYRTMAQAKTVNGYTCEMYQRIVARRIDAEICFVLWGDAIGQKEDFEWFDTLQERMLSDFAGKRAPAFMFSGRYEAPGLPIWTSSIDRDGTREVTEILSLRRDPLPPSMFHVPADYVQMERPVTASERTTSGPPPADFSKTAGARSEGRPGLKISGLAAIVLVFALGFGFLIHSGLLHLAASIVLDHPRFMQAMIATVILWVVGGFVSLFGLPWILGLPASAFATFAGLKISYGTSVPRTLALWFVSLLIALMMAFVGRIFT